MRKMEITYNFKWLYIALVALFCLPVVNYYIGEIYWAFDMVNPFSQLFYSIIYCFGAFAYVYKINTRKVTCVLIYILALFVSFLITPNLSREITGPVLLQSQFMSFSFIYFPIFLIAVDERINYTRVYALLGKTSIAITALCIIAFIAQVFFSGKGLEEYMTFAYTGLPFILLCIHYSWSNRNLIGKVLSILGFSTVLFGGCRGALVTILLFVFTYIVFGIRNSKTIVTVLIFSILLSFFMPDILEFAGNLFESFGYESRIFRMMESGSAMESDGRMATYKKALEVIDVYPNGLFADRVLLERVYDSKYCHNWILEFWVDYGWLLGTILATIVLIKLASLTIWYVKHKDQSNFMICFAICMILGKYMLSNSYLNSPEMALIFGWFIYSNKKLYATT